MRNSPRFRGRPRSPPPQPLSRSESSIRLPRGSPPQGRAAVGCSPPPTTPGRQPGGRWRGRRAGVRTGIRGARGGSVARRAGTANSCFVALALAQTSETKNPGTGRGLVQSLVYPAWLDFKNPLFSSAPSRSRTYNLRFRRPTLYPVELWVRVSLPARPGGSDTV